MRGVTAALELLKRAVSDSWDVVYGGELSRILRIANSPETCRLSLGDGAAPGRPAFAPYPRFDDHTDTSPCWIEGGPEVFACLAPRGYSSTSWPDARVAVLFESEGSTEGLLAARFLIFVDGVAGVALAPGQVLIDTATYTGASGGLGIADRLRAEHGLRTTGDATLAELVEMANTAVVIRDEFYVHAIPTARVPATRSTFDPYLAAADHGYGELQSALASIVVKRTGSNLSADFQHSASEVDPFFYNVLHHGPFLACWLLACRPRLTARW